MELKQEIKEEKQETPEEEKKKMTPEEVFKMIEETRQSLAQTLQSCNSTLKMAQETRQSCVDTNNKIDKFKDDYKKALDQMVISIGRGMKFSKPILEDVQQYGSSNNNTTVKQIIDILQTKKHLIFLTGAGISVASGIAPYRGEGSQLGITINDKFYPNEEVAKVTFMKSNPEIFWPNYYNRFFNTASKCEPNKTHLTIAKIMQFQNKLKTTLITQNIDHLHIKAYEQINNIQKTQLSQKTNLKMNPTDNIFQIHGNMNYFRCEQNCTKENKIFKTPFQELQKNQKQQPKCEFCKNLARPNVLYFDEAYDEDNFYVESLKNRIENDKIINKIQEIEISQRLKQQQIKQNQEIQQQNENQQKQNFEDSCLLVIGTTLETGLAHTLVSQFIKSNLTIIEINKEGNIIKSGKNTFNIQGKAEEIVPSILDPLIKQFSQNKK